MKKITGRGLKGLKAAHFLGIFAWMGGCIAALILLTQVSNMPDTVGMIYLLKAMELIDWYAICTGAIFTVLLGLFYGFFTNWRFFKFRWLVSKWILSLTIIITASCFYLQNIENMREILLLHGIAAIQNELFQIYLHNQYCLILCHLLLMVLITIISVFKPWSRPPKPSFKS